MWLLLPWFLPLFKRKFHFHVLGFLTVFLLFLIFFCFERHNNKTWTQRCIHMHLTIAQCASIRINNSIQKLKWSSLHFRKNIASVVSRLIRTAHGLRTRTLYSLHPGNRMKRAFRKRRHRRALRCIDLETYLIYAACWYWENLTIIYHPPKTTFRVLFLTYNKYMIYVT